MNIKYSRTFEINKYKYYLCSEMLEYNLAMLCGCSLQLRQARQSASGTI